MLILCDVNDNENRVVPSISSHFFKKELCLLGIDNNGMGLYDVKRKWIHTLKKNEMISSCSGFIFHMVI